MRTALTVLVVLLVAGLLLAGANAPEHTPVPAQQAIEQRHREEVLGQQSEEEQRQAASRDDEEPSPPAGWDNH